MCSSDLAVFPRDKCCGDGLTTLALRRLHELGLDPGSVPSWTGVASAWLRSPAGREVELPLPTNGSFAAVTPRLELDDALVRLARASGVEVREDTSFVGAVEEDDAVAVTVRSQEQETTIRAAWVVAADGMWSPVRKALGVAPPNYLGEWHAFRQYASNVTGVGRDRLIVWFDEDLLPGYAWSFPLPDGRANIGFGVWRDGVRRIQDMNRLWTDLLGRPHVREALGADVVLEGRHTAWPIPARIDRAVTGVGRVLFAGDAAMATDALTGEGIGQALLTGMEASRAIATGSDPADVRRTYRRAVDHHLAADHRMSLRLGRVLAHRRGAEGAISLLAHAGDWSRRMFARWMFEDEPRAILLTPRRWHRRVLRQPGAY